MQNFRHFKYNYVDTSGTIFSADVWISGGQLTFNYKTWCISLEAFASKTGTSNLVDVTGEC